MAKDKQTKNYSQMTIDQLKQLITRGGKRKVMAINELVKRGVGA